MSSFSDKGSEGEWRNKYVEESMASPSKVPEHPTSLSELDTKEYVAPPLVEASGQQTPHTPSSGDTADSLTSQEEQQLAKNLESPLEAETREVRVLWGPGLILLVIAVLLGATIRYLRPGPMGNPGEPGFPQIMAQRLTLPDGRRIAYREQGASAKDAKRALLVVHGLYSSRLGGIPGISDELLQEYRVRLVAYDRPGYGQSDPHPNRTLETSAYDMEGIADALNLGSKFWVLGYSGGGPHAWAAAKFIPDRLAGIAMFAPTGNPFKSNMTKEEIGWFRNLPWSSKLPDWVIPRYAPFLAPVVFHNLIVPSIDKSISTLPNKVGKKDSVLLSIPEFLAELKADIHEGLRQQHGLPVAQELVMTTHSWGFDIGELEDTSVRESLTSAVRRFMNMRREKRPRFTGPIHIWQGTDDRLVPHGMALYAKRRVPRIHLHLLEGEGHFSWFCWCDTCHREIMETLFGIKAYRH